MDEVCRVMDFPDLLKFILEISLSVKKKKSYSVGCCHLKVGEITEYL